MRLPQGAAVDVSRGYAHGLAGVIDVYRGYLERTDDQRADHALHTAVEELTTASEALVHDARRSAALPMSVSWCQGLSGIAPALLRAAPMLSSPALRSRVEHVVTEIADTVEAWTPRIDLRTGAAAASAGATSSSSCGNSPATNATRSARTPYWVTCCCATPVWTTAWSCFRPAPTRRCRGVAETPACSRSCVVSATATGSPDPVNYFAGSSRNCGILRVVFFWYSA